MIMEMEPFRQISHILYCGNNFQGLVTVKFDSSFIIYFFFNSEYYKKDVLKEKIWDLIPLNQFVFNISVCIYGVQGTCDID